MREEECNWDLRNSLWVIGVVCFFMVIVIFLKYNIVWKKFFGYRLDGIVWFVDVVVLKIYVKL